MSCHCGHGGTATLSFDDPARAPEAPTIALIGNPNVGKSTLFNSVTGAKQAVINAPGTTVEMMEGRWSALNARILDLPGTYSLIANSPDEQVVVDTLAGMPGSLTDPEKGQGIDLALVILDATSLTRSLYVLGQVARIGLPVAGIITLADVLEHDGGQLDVAALEEALGIPLFVTDPRKDKPAQGLEAFVKGALLRRPQLRGISPCCHQRNPKFDSLEDTDGIFNWVAGIEAQALASHSQGAEVSTSDKVDRFLLHPLVGIPVFFALMWLLFKVAGEWVGPVQDAFDGIFTSEDEGALSLANGFNMLLAMVGWEETWLQGLLVGGIATGLGVVASFLPLMFVIFLLISILEDSGYMARAAFLGDRVMRLIGLDGRVIMPLIMGFGCNLPSLAATRTLPNTAQRLVTTLVIPYTSCAARLTIYLMIARIFFPENTGTVVFVLYMLSLIMVIIGALVLKPFFTRDTATAPLMLVLPAYQVPRVFVTVKNTWMRAWAFVQGAGKIIIGMTLVVWLMGAIPMTGQHSFADPELPMEESLYGRTAQVLVPAFAPTGFGEWHMTGALMTGFVAKETVISSIVGSYNMDPEVDGGDAEDGGDDLGKLPGLVTKSFEKSAGDAAPIAAFAFLVFVLTYTPCLATVAEQVRQIGWKLATGAVVVQFAAAWVLAVAVFQIGRLIL